MWLVCVVGWCGWLVGWLVGWIATPHASQVCALSMLPQGDARIPFDHCQFNPISCNRQLYTKYFLSRALWPCRALCRAERASWCERQETQRRHNKFECKRESDCRTTSAALFANRKSRRIRSHGLFSKRFGSFTFSLRRSRLLGDCVPGAGSDCVNEGVMVHLRRPCRGFQKRIFEGNLACQT